MKRFFAGVIALAVGCGGTGSATDPDAGPGGGDDGDRDGGASGGDDAGSSVGPRTVKLTLPNRPNNAQQFSFVVAYQDGSAPWQLAPAPTGDTYEFTVNAPTYGVAFACIGSVTGQGASQQRSVTVAHFAVGERTEVTLDVPARCSDRNASLVTLSGNVSNRSGSGLLLVQFGTRTGFVGSTSGNFSLQVPPGTRDLIVSRMIPEGNNEFYVSEVLVQRDVAVTANTMRQLDFDAARSTTNLDVSVSGLPFNTRVVASTTLYTANGTSAQLVRESQGWESDILDASQRRPTDVYEQSIAVSSFGAGATITRAATAPGDQTWQAPAPLGAIMTTVPTKTPYVTLQSTWGPYANAVGYVWNATQQVPCNSGSCTIVWTAYLSPGVTGASPGFRMPDLAGLSGWKEAYQLVSGLSLTGGVTAITSSAGPSDFPTGIPAAGTDRAFVRTDFGLAP